MQKIGGSVALLIGALGVAGNCLAQALPDPAIELQRQQQQLRELRQRQEATADVRLGAAATPAFKLLPQSETPCFVIQRIELGGTVPEFGALQDVLGGPHGGDAPQGRCLGAQGIQILVERLQNRLIGMGYITSRAQALAQDLKTGVLTLTLTPGRLGSARFTPLPAQKTDPTSLRSAMPLEPGDLLTLQAMEQTLENLRQLPSVQADIQIAPGGGPGQSDLLIGYQQTRPLRLALSADDGGAMSTGKYQSSATLSWDNPLKLNDLFYLTSQQDLGGGDPGQRSANAQVLHYSVPWGYWRLGMTASKNHYHQAVVGATQTYLYSGESSSHSLQLDRLLHRNASGKTSLSLKVFARTSKNFIDDTEVEVQRRRTGGWELEAAHKHYRGEAALDARLAVRRGTGAFGAMPAPEERFGEGTAHMEMYTASFGAETPLGVGDFKLHYSGNFRAQWNGTALTPQDRFCIGGRNTVRGTDGKQSLCAERGELLRNEISTALAGGSHRLYAAVDLGHVSGTQLDQHLHGAVVGLRGSAGALVYDVFAGQALHQPAGFETAPTSVGFSLSTSF